MIKFKTKENGLLIEYLNDPFFNSLRSDYSEFDEWYTKNENDKDRISYYWIDENNKLVAFLALKIENEAISLNKQELSKIERIKMSTIKSKNGRLDSFSQIAVYLATKKAIDLKIDEVYYTINNQNKENNCEKNKLTKILQDYGFNKIGEKSNGNINESYFIKSISKPNESLTNWMHTYPKVPKKIEKKWTYLTLDHNYHDTYIQGANLKGIKQKINFSKMAIKKAYIHNQDGIMKLSQNDGLLIYRKSSVNKQHKSCVTSYGTILKNKLIRSYPNFESFKKEIRNYHSFENENELRKWFHANKYVTFFILNNALGKGKNITYKMLKDNGYFDQYPSNNIFNDKQVKLILQLWNKKNKEGK